MADQRLKYRKLTTGERHRLVFAEHFTRTEVKFELTESNYRLFL